MSTYATKFHIKCTTDIDILKFAKKANLASLRLDVDKLNIGNLKTTHVDLCKVSNVVKNYVVQKTEYDKLVEKVNPIQAIDASNLVKKAE